MAVTSSTLVQFRAGPLMSYFNRRGGSPGVLAKRDIERYYVALGKSIAEAHFNFPEAMLCLETLKDIPAAPQTIRLLPAIVIDLLSESDSSIPDAFRRATLVHRLKLINKEMLEYSAEKTRVYIDSKTGAELDPSDLMFSVEGLIKKLQGLSYSQLLSIWDAAERWEHALEDAYVDMVDMPWDEGDTTSFVRATLSDLHIWKPVNSASSLFLDKSRACNSIIDDLASEIKLRREESPSNAKTEG